MYTIADLQLNVAYGQLDDRRRIADARRVLRRLRRGRRSESGRPVTNAPVAEPRRPAPTFANVLEQLGIISDGHRFTNAGEDHVALRRLVAELVSVAAADGVVDVPTPSRRDPAVAVLRIAGVLASRTIGREVSIDGGARRRLQRRLDDLRRATKPPWLDRVRVDADVVRVHGVGDVGDLRRSAA